MDHKLLNTSLRSIIAFMLLFLLFGAAPGLILPAQAAPGDLTRASVDSSGAQANSGSGGAAVSGDGRFIAFHSGASNLVPGDTNNTEDVFVRDRLTSTTSRVSVDSSGTEGNNSSLEPAISSDGRFVAFYSDATNLVSGDNNGIADIFVHDRQTGQTTRVSVDSSGLETNAVIDEDRVDISGDGRFVAFSAEDGNLVSGDTNGVSDVFVHDRNTAQTTRVSVGLGGGETNGGSRSPAISSDGRFVAFASSGTNLVSNDNNGKTDVFVYDRQTGATNLASVNSSGELGDAGGSSPDISGDGRYVVFLSSSNNIDPTVTDSNKPLIYVHDNQGGQTTLVSTYSSGVVLTTGLLDQPTISSNGRYVAFSYYDKGENNGIMNIWARDLQNGKSVQLAGGNQSSFNPAISANGEIVAFNSSASLVSEDSNGVDDIFVKEVIYGPESNPTVVSVTPKCGLYIFQCPYPTPSSVSFIVMFSEQVSGVSVDDFSLEASAGISGASISGVSGYGREYYVTVNTGTGEGTLRLKLFDNDSIVDTSLNPLGGAGAGNGDFTNGKLYQIEKSNPVVTSIVRADPNPTSAAEVHFTVNFSEEVWPVKLSAFNLAVTGSISGASVTAISPREDEYRGFTTFTVTVNSGTGDGTLRLDVIDDDSILDWNSNPLGGSGPGNGDFSTGEAYTINKSGPSIPSVTSVLRAAPNPTAADLVSFTVNFSEPVSGVDSSDFTVTTSGNLTSAMVANLSGAGTSYIVLAATGSGDGGLRLDVLDDDSVVSASGTPLGGAGAGNGVFTSGEAYTVDKTAPTVTASLRTDSNPNSAQHVTFHVVFSEAVTGLDSSDFFVFTTGTISGAYVQGVGGSDYQYTITVNTGTGDGRLRLDILDDDSIRDGLGHPLGGAGIGNGNFSTGEEYLISRTPVNKMTETIRSNGANDGWVLESAEDTDRGGFKDAISPTIVLGDDYDDRQFRSILHFPTDYLPDNAVVTKALLMLKGEGVAGTNPFETHQNIQVDIRSGAFGFIGPFPYRGLQVSDFQSPAHQDAVGMIQNNPYNGWYWTWLDPSAFQYINLTGVTQLRLRFQLDDNDNMQYDYIRFYSGDYDGLADRPRLVVEYYTR